MAITVKMEYDNYTDFCETTNIGRQFLELPESIIESLNNIYDGSDIDGNGGLHPDNVYVNFFVQESDSEFLVGRDFLSTEEYEKMVESDTLEDYISENMDEIQEDVDITVLGREDKTWYGLY